MIHATPTLCLALLLVLNGIIKAAMVEIGAARDNTLYYSEAGDISNGSGQFMFVGTIATAPATRRGLVAFDVAAALPPSANVTAVALRLYMSRTISGPQRISLHRLSRDWGEGSSNALGQEGMGAPAAGSDATWTHAAWPTTAWVTRGGDFAMVPSASIMVTGIGDYTWGSSPEMVADVQAWLDDPYSNFGWLLLADESASGTAKRFDTREHPTSSNHPVLMIRYSSIPEPSTALHLAWLLVAARIRTRCNKQNRRRGDERSH